MLLIYIILVGNKIIEINHITDLFNKTFRIKNLGDLTYFLCLKVVRNKNEIHLCQRKC